MPPKKSKKDEPCYTRTNKGGGKYVTCEGEQKRNKKFAKEISSLGKTSDKLQAAKKAKAKAPVKAKAKAPVKATEKQKELMRKRREAAKAKKAKAAKPKPKVDKDLLQKVLPIMADVGKSKGKSDSGQIKDRARWAKQDEAIKKRGIVVGAEIYLGQKVAKQFGKLTIDDTSSWVTFNRKGGDGYEDLGSIDFKDVKVNAKGVVLGKVGKVYNGGSSWSEAGF